MKIIADLHTHTNVIDHAYSTFEEMVQGAKRAGLSVIAITNHGPLMEDAVHHWHFDTLYRLPRVVDGVFVLRGIELNILPPLGGTDPIRVKTMRCMEQCIASFHEGCYQPASAEDHTTALEGILKNPYVNLLGHLGNPKFPFDMEAIISQCNRYGKAVEINNGTFFVRPQAVERCRQIALLCKEYRVPVMVNSDAHISYEVGGFSQALSMLSSIDFPEELIINGDMGRLKTYFKALRGVDIAV